MRFLLGVAEAGLYPGMLLFFTYWFPDWHRARIVAGFTIALPLAVAVGSPTSTALLELNGVWGLAGWKWMFIAEAMPTILVGIFFLLFVTDRPAIDLLFGSDRERLALDAGQSWQDIAAAWEPEETAFRDRRRPYLLYPEPATEENQPHPV